MEVGEFGLCTIFFVYLGLGREEMRVQRGEERKIKKMLIRWVRVMEVGEFGLCTIFFVYLGLGREEMKVQGREERKIKKMLIG